MENKNEEIPEIAHKNRSMSMMCLLFDEACAMPLVKDIYEQLSQRGYQVDAEWEADDKSLRLFYLPQYTVDFEDAKGVPYQLAMFDGTKIEKAHGSDTARTQFWKTPDGVELLDSCPWQVMISDFMSSAHAPKVRAQILSDWLDISLTLFPSCKAVWFEGSQNVMTVNDLKTIPMRGSTGYFTEP